MTTRTFVPAAGQDRWLPFYDIGTKLLGAPAAQRALLAQADLRDGQRVLDLGCGTGTLVVMLKSQRPLVHVVGLDPDPLALERAKRKAERAGVAIELVRGFADSIPQPDASFDRVVSSFMLHHLSAEEKTATLRDVHRVLKPGGTFHLLDFAAPEETPRGLIARLLHRDGHLHGLAPARLVTMLLEAALVDATHVETRGTLFGPIAFYSATRR